MAAKKIVNSKTKTKAAKGGAPKIAKAPGKKGGGTKK
jgi:hypothetical protein